MCLSLHFYAMPPSPPRRRLSRIAARRKEILACMERLCRDHCAILTLLEPSVDASYGGWFEAPNTIAIVRNDVQPHYMLCYLMHELGHLYCLRNGLFAEYHVHDQLDDRAYEAELWVSRHAEKEYREAGFERRFGKYSDGYLEANDDDTAARRWLLEKQHKLF